MTATARERLRYLAREWLVRHFSDEELIAVARSTGGGTMDDVVARLGRRDLRVLRGMWRGRLEGRDRSHLERTVKAVADPGSPVPVVWYMIRGGGGGGAPGDQRASRAPAEGNAPPRCATRDKIRDMVGPWFASDSLWRQAQVSSLEGAREGMRAVVRDVVAPLVRRTMARSGQLREGLRRGMREGLQDGIQDATVQSVRESIEQLSPGDLQPPDTRDNHASWKQGYSAVACERCAEVEEVDENREDPPAAAAPPRRPAGSPAAPRKKRHTPRKRPRPPCVARGCVEYADHYLRSSSGRAINMLRHRALLWPLAGALEPRWWTASGGFIPVCSHHRASLWRFMRIQHPLLYAQLYAPTLKK